MQDNKIVVLVEESPEDATFNEVASILGLKGVDPLNFIEPESHMLSTIYRDVFVSETANELMGYMINKRKTPIVFDIFDKVYGDNERLVLVNTTLLTDEDIRFLSETLTNIMTVNLSGSAQKSARKIYDASKSLRDRLEI